MINIPIISEYIFKVRYMLPDSEKPTEPDKVFELTYSINLPTIIRIDNIGILVNFLIKEILFLY